MNLLEWIRKALTAWHGIFSLFACIVFSGVLLSLERSEREVFHEVMIGTFLYPVQEVFSRVNGTVRVYRENEELKRANAALRVENDLLRQDLRQQPRLQELERFGASVDMRLKSGRVIAQDPGRLQMAWVVDLGRSDSVGRNMPVLTARGVVGKTAKCFRGHSVVQLLTDPAFKASVQNDRSRARGILESYRLNRLVARFPAGSDVIPGDTLITAGLGGVFPKGLRIGVAEEEIPEGEEQSSDVLRSFFLSPFQELNTVEEIFVLIRQDRWSIAGDSVEAESP
jgi:rod shape-determining protein MreC